MAAILMADGRRPGLEPASLATPTHLAPPPHERWPEVVVHVDPATFGVTAARVR